jgi:hypothetical protein
LLASVACALHAQSPVADSFNPGANNYALSLAVQPDGKILVGGNFTTLGGQSRMRIGRLTNTEPATQSLSCDGTTVTWLRGGTSPEVWHTTFELSTDGVTWTNLGAGLRIPGGWQRDNISLPAGGAVRARGWVAVSYEGASWFVESTLPLGLRTPPSILANDGNFGVRTNQFGFNLSGVSGQIVVVEASTNLVTWLPLQTNVLDSDRLYFSDPDWSLIPQRMYRVKLWP